ncbi:MAG: AsmA-like C-terminal region-containing protein [bacterium]|nr:AsmA-like C-terminal region-containing protein [bacterium]
MKFLKYFLIGLVVIIGLLLVAPFLFKGKIVNLIKEQANANVNAVINFDEDIDLSLISNFPQLSLGIKNLSVSGIEPFNGDTLFWAAETSLSLDLMSVIKGEQIQIRKLLLDQPRIMAYVLKDGRYNWDIAKVDTSASKTPADTGSSKFNIKLKSLEIVNGYIVYNDKEGNMYSEMKGVNYTLEGDFSDVLFTMVNKMNIASFTVAMDGLTYLSKVQATATAEIEADMNNMKFVFKNNEFSLNQLAFGFNGTFAMPGNDMVMDIKYAAKQNEFKNFLSLIPALYANDFASLQAKGKLAFSGFVKGTYNEKQMPGFGLNLSVEKGWFKYSSLPTAVENVAILLNVKNLDGDLDHTEIDLNKLHFELQGDAFDAKLLARTPLSDPFVDAKANGVINLDNIIKLAPIPAGTTLRGLIKLNLLAKGKVSTLEKENYEAFEASGNMICENIYYASADLPKPFEVKHSEMSFTPKEIVLKDFDAKIGNSDMRMDGAIANFLPYYFGKGVLGGKLNFNSNVFNANEYLTKEPAAGSEVVADTSLMTVFEVPANIDFTLNSKIGKLLYTNMEITRFVGNIRVVNQQLIFQNMSLSTLGSDITMKGFYETKNVKKPTVDIDFGITNLNIQEAFKTFNTVKKLAPAAEHVFGTFSTTFKMKTDLTENMQPIYSTLFAEGLLLVPSAEIKGITTIDKITDLIKKPEYKQVGLSNAKIAYKVENGRIFTQPFDVKVGRQVMSLSGSTGLDQSIDYTGLINVPRKDLGTADKAMTDALAELNKKAGTSLKMNETLPLKLGVGGTFTSPVITTNLTDLAKSEVTSITDQALNAAKQKKDELTNQAKAELDKAQKEAEAKIKAESDRIKKEAEAKAKSEANRLKMEAEAKAKAESDKLKKQAEDEAKKRLKGLLK